MSENSTHDMTAGSALPLAVVHCYNVSAMTIENRTVVTSNCHDTAASAAKVKSAQLHALLSAAAEVSGGAVQDIRDNLLNLAADVAQEVRALCDLAERASEVA